MNVKKWLPRPLRCRPLRGLVGTAGQPPNSRKSPTAWMGRSGNLPHLVCQAEGNWDKEVGHEVELLYFHSGKDALRTLPRQDMVIGGNWERYPPVHGRPCATNTYDHCHPPTAHERWHVQRAVMVRPDSPNIADHRVL